MMIIIIKLVIMKNKKQIELSKFQMILSLSHFLLYFHPTFSIFPFPNSLNVRSIVSLQFRTLYPFPFVGDLLCVSNPVSFIHFLGALLCNLLPSSMHHFFFYVISYSSLAVCYSIPLAEV